MEIQKSANSIQKPKATGAWITRQMNPHSPRVSRATNLPSISWAYTFMGEENPQIQSTHKTIDLKIYRIHRIVETRRRIHFPYRNAHCIKYIYLIWKSLGSLPNKFSYFFLRVYHTVKPPTQNILFMKVSWNYRELSYIVEQAILPKQQYVLK